MNACRNMFCRIYPVSGRTPHCTNWSLPFVCCPAATCALPANGQGFGLETRGFVTVRGNHLPDRLSIVSHARSVSDDNGDHNHSKIERFVRLTIFHLPHCGLPCRAASCGALGRSACAYWAPRVPAGVSLGLLSF